MNRYKIMMALMLVLSLLAAGCGAAPEPADNANVPSTEVSIPAVEGNETIEDVPENEGVAQRPTESTPSTEATKPTESSKPTEATQPEETTAPTKPSEPDSDTETTDPANPEEKPCCDYFVYLSLSPADQQTFMGTFGTTMEFVEWCRQGEAAHKEHEETITGEGDEFDISDILDKINGKS